MRASNSDEPSRDRIGRRLRDKRTPAGKRITLNDRDMVWFEKMHEHGPLPSSFLLAFTKGTHKSEKRSLERLTDLFNETTTPHGGAYLSRPPQQWRTIDSRHNQLVYDLTDASRAALREEGLLSAYRPGRSGPWLHSFMVSCVTASVELAAQARPDISYLSQSFLLERADTELRYPVIIADTATGRYAQKHLIPDALFGLRYETAQGSMFRCFLVEADRSTEPLTSANFNRKSWERNISQYETYVGNGHYRRHLNLKAPMLVLVVLGETRRLAPVLNLVPRYAPTTAEHLLFTSWESFSAPFAPPRPNTAMLEEPWQRAGLAEFSIGRV